VRPNSSGAAGQRSADLIDVLFALTSFEMFEALSVRSRRSSAIEALLQALVEQVVDRYCSGAGDTGSGH
jgi:hypothetical protein